MLLVLLYTSWKPEAATGGILQEKLVLNISQYPQVNTWAAVSFY